MADVKTFVQIQMAAITVHVRQDTFLVQIIKRVWVSREIFFVSLENKSFFEDMTENIQKTYQRFHINDGEL